MEHSMDIQAVPMTAALDIRGLTKRYANGHTALQDMDLTVTDGDFFALLGPNGAGKSTTIGIITTLVTKTAGCVRVFGHDLDQDPQAVKRNLGLVPQEFNFNGFEPVGEIVVNQAGFYGIPRAEAWRRAEHYLRELGLWEKHRDMARTLSGGMKRRLMIARALVHEPRLLILDEPTAGVDIELRRSMWTFLRRLNQEGRSIILTTHYLEEAEQLCRSIAILDAGSIVENTSMKNLLAKLDVETLVLDLAQPIAAEPLPTAWIPPDVPGTLTPSSPVTPSSPATPPVPEDPLRLQEASGIVLRRLDALTLEADIRRGQELNQLFRQLDHAGIAVRSMRNKSNRLEELFLKITQARSLAEQASVTPPPVTPARTVFAVHSPKQSPPDDERNPP